MIQRFQTIYLLLTTLFSILFLSGKMLVLKNETGVVELHGIILPLVVLLILIAAISLLTIFLFKNRKFQLKLSIALIVLSIILILALAYYAFTLSGKYNAPIQFSINLIFPVMVLVFSILAYRGIKKDDELVKSYDRLR
jgi:phosphoglycerol transferase MdoB-like AlkP superfamily enzyme